jgi:ABC-type transport system substrate-binding protein
MTIKKQGFVFLVLTILFTLACNSVNRVITGQGNSATVGYDIDSENAIILSGGQPQTLDPAKTHGGASGPIGGIFSGLVTLDTNLQVQPSLATGWEINQDRTIYTFYLDEDAKFHNGRPVTAQDVIFSWERAANPATESDTAQTYLGDIVGVSAVLQGQAEHIEGLRAIDDHTLEVQIDAPKAYFLSKLTYPVAFVVDPDDVSQSDWDHQPNGTGPFVLQEWQDDEVLIISRNDNYYGARPAVDQVVYLMGAGIPLSMYEKGEIDLVGVGGSTLERVQDPNSQLFPDLQLGINMCTNMIGFNSRQPPFDDPHVRQAFNYALDRERLIDGLYKGNALPATGPLPPGMPGYTGDSQAYRFDPEKARALLAEAGYEDLSTFPMVTYATSGYGSVDAFVTAVITMWQENLGVTIEPVLIDPFKYLDELYAGNVGNIFDHGWCADYPDPENFLDILYHSNSTQNLGGYGNQEVDVLLEKARTEQDVTARMTLYGDIEQLIVADAPAAFITHSMSAVLVKPHMKNYKLTPIGVAQWHQIELNK